MQKEESLTPTMRRTQNFARTRTPDRMDEVTRARSRGQRRGRTTMAPSEFAVPGAAPTRRAPNLNTTRISMMPPNPLDCTRRIEVEFQNNELSSVYDKYIQTLMEEHIMEKKMEEREKAMVTQLTALAKEEEQCDEKLHEIKMIEYDNFSSNEIQKNLDSQMKEIAVLLKTYQGKPDEILGLINSLLKTQDTLTCKDIIIPRSPEEIQKLIDCLQKSNELLISINSITADKAKAMNAGSQGIKDFIQTQDSLQKHLANLEIATESLQIEVLKITSAALSSLQDRVGNRESA